MKKSEFGLSRLSHVEIITGEFIGGFLIVYEQPWYEHESRDPHSDVAFSTTVRKRGLADGLFRINWTRSTTNIQPGTE
ncbi:hypothetical protein N7457_002391 [Penicillium paradoxum]|uniref:uncharacterized protein n=1 Tax=Penicillium paradoxum TaxID=176176 RepID=UPI002546FCFB|nr:uncharacterized protein N7457_002391 [Penicillium paradoxum]KAJ5787401.1 hypothetical protein N7457_002391 [Penicillium paradoxum]